MGDARSLARLAEESYERLGDHDALVFEGRTLRSSELRERARRVAGGLADLGIGVGDRVVVFMANCPEVVITYQAVWRAGAVVTPAVFLLTAAELRHILIDSEAVAVVTTAELLATAVAATDGVATVRHLVVAAGGGVAVADGERALVAFADLEEAEERARADLDDSALAALLYTGGTTGRAKGVALRHSSLWAAGEGAFRSSHVPGVVRALMPLPLSHAYGLLVTVIGMHSDEPGLAVVQRWFNAADFLALAAEHRVERTALVPAMVQMLLAEPLEAADLSSLRFVTSGAAPLALDVLHEFERRVPSCLVLEGYGLTESSGVISSTPPGRRRVGSVGLPIAGCEVRIVDEDGVELGPGADGEICARGPNLMSGYWHAPAETAAAIRDGWLHTGDVGHRDADGYLYVVDRIKDLILRGGFNVFPRDVEDVLLGHPAVAMAGVVGRPDPRLGEEVVAFVSLRPGARATAEELIAHSRQVLAPTKSPREVRIVDAVPLTSVGKLDRKKLRALLG